MMFHWYGLFIGIAIVVGWSVAEKIEPKVNKVAPWVLGFGFVGARLYHVVDLWEYYGQNLAQVVAVWNGGISIWGGLIGGAVGLWAGGWSVSILGAIVTGLPLSQAIGRIGNGVNGEFVNKVWILPWWGAEAIADLFLFCLIWIMSSRAKSRDPSTTVGMTNVFVYLVGYGLIRLVLQPYRL